MIGSRRLVALLLGAAVLGAPLAAQANSTSPYTRMNKVQGRGMAAQPMATGQVDQPMVPPRHRRAMGRHHGTATEQ